MSDETEERWTVLLSDGAHLPVTVLRAADGWHARYRDLFHGAAYTPRAAIVDLASRARHGEVVGWPVVQIVAPGGQSVDERIGRARQEERDENTQRVLARADVGTLIRALEVRAQGLDSEYPHARYAQKWLDLMPWLREELEKKP